MSQLMRTVIDIGKLQALKMMHSLVRISWPAVLMREEVICRDAPRSSRTRQSVFGHEYPTSRLVHLQQFADSGTVRRPRNLAGGHRTEREYRHKQVRSCAYRASSASTIIWQHPNVQWSKDTLHLDCEQARKNGCKCGPGHCILLSYAGRGTGLHARTNSGIRARAVQRARAATGSVNGDVPGHGGDGHTAVGKADVAGVDSS